MKGKGLLRVREEVLRRPDTNFSDDLIIKRSYKYKAWRKRDHGVICG